MTRTIGISSLACSLLAVLGASLSASADDAPPPRVVSFYGYDDCLRLENEHTTVTLCPAAGGRVLQYAWKGRNALYLPPGGEGWRYQEGRGGGPMNAGRFDIGPEQTIAKHPRLWSGPWQGEVTGPRSARLTSVKDSATGVQLVRDFVLDEQSSRLACTQMIKNISANDTVEYCHWSRTFALGKGIVVIPRTRPSRFPHGYVMYAPAPVINFRPEDPRIHVRDDFVEITGAPKFPKLGLDSQAGWLAYLMPNDLMFVKRFPTYPDRVYNEVAGLTLSIWYPDRPMCELEPIGPRQRLAPGDSASFTETWWLLERAFPTSGRADLKSVSQQVSQQAK